MIGFRFRFKGMFFVVGFLQLALVEAVSEGTEKGTIILNRKIDVPSTFLTRNEDHAFGGYIRIGDLSGNGVCDFVAYRSVQ